MRLVWTESGLGRLDPTETLHSGRDQHPLRMSLIAQVFSRRNRAGRSTWWKEVMAENADALPCTIPNWSKTDCMVNLA